MLYVSEQLSVWSSKLTLNSPLLVAVCRLSDLATACPPYADDVLYYADLSSSFSMSGVALPNNLLYYSPELRCPTVNASFNSICLSSKITFEALNDVCNRVFSFFKSYHHLIQSFLNIIDSESAAQQIADLCYDFWHCPMAMYDSSLRLIATCSQFTTLNKEQQEIRDAGYMGNKNLKRFRLQKRFKVMLSDLPYKITNISDIGVSDRIAGQNYNYVDVPIRIQGTPVGIISLIGTSRMLDTMDADCLLDVSRFFATTLQRNGQYVENISNPYEAILHEILSERLVDDAIIHDRFHALGRTLKQIFYVISIPFSAQMRRKFRVDELQNSLRELIPDCITAYYDNHITLLVSKNKDAPPVNFEDLRLFTFMQVNGLKAGLSTAFLLPSLMNHYFKQASLALIYGTRFAPEHVMYPYSDYLMMHVLDVCSESVDLYDLCHPAVLALNLSGKSSDAILLETIRCYLLNDRDVPKTCDTLYIQRSTLFYRINKFKQMVNSDLNNSELLLHLLFSFKILEYLSKAPHKFLK